MTVMMMMTMMMMLTMMMMMMNSRYYQAIYRCLNDFMQNQPNCVSEVRDAILEAARLYTLPFTSKYDCSVVAASPGSSSVAIAKPRRFFFVAPLHFFGSINTIGRFGERFRNGQYSLVSLLFAAVLLTVLSPVPSHL